MPPRRSAVQERPPALTQADLDRLTELMSPEDRELVRAFEAESAPTLADQAIEVLGRRLASDAGTTTVPEPDRMEARAAMPPSPRPTDGIADPLAACGLLGIVATDIAVGRSGVTLRVGLGIVTESRRLFAAVLVELDSAAPDLVLVGARLADRVATGVAAILADCGAHYGDAPEICPVLLVAGIDDEADAAALESDFVDLATRVAPGAEHLTVTLQVQYGPIGPPAGIPADAIAAIQEDVAAMVRSEGSASTGSNGIT